MHLLLGNCMSCLVISGDMNAMSKMSVLRVLLSRCTLAACAHHYLNKIDLD